VCNADARDHRRVANDGWRAGEVVEESSSGAKKNRRDVDVDFVEEASIQELLDGVSAVDPNGLPGGGGFGLTAAYYLINQNDTAAEAIDLCLEALAYGIQPWESLYYSRETRKQAALVLGKLEQPAFATSRPWRSARPATPELYSKGQRPRGYGERADSR